MIFKQKIFVSALSLTLATLAVPSTAAFAAPTTMQAGVKVSDTQGGEVGTITAADGDYVTLKTDKHEVRMPAASFTAVDNGFIMAMTRDQLNAAVESSLAKAESLVAVGAVVKDTAGGTVGTIEALDDQFATVKLSKSAVKLPRSAIAATPDGPVIGMTAAELEAQVPAATPEADAAPKDAASK